MTSWTLCERPNFPDWNVFFCGCYIARVNKLVKRHIKLSKAGWQQALRQHVDISIKKTQFFWFFNGIKRLLWHIEAFTILFSSSSSLQIYISFKFMILREEIAKARNHKEKEKLTWWSHRIRFSIDIVAVWRWAVADCIDRYVVALRVDCEAVTVAASYADWISWFLLSHFDKWLQTSSVRRHA